MVGKTLGHYEILEPLGKGGMGEVYRARDTTLKRDVAIKVLPEELNADPDRLARLEREAHLLAALNHANIATIHALEEDQGARFLVLELVKGESLEQRLSKGPLPVDEALDLCKQIAEALEAAHGEGIIHRDLKPANVLITPEGKAKVLDFGLAKTVEGAAPEADMSHSPTVTVMGTQDGVILGTAPYMSPEQMRGQPLDKRADIWAFGCVLYEALVGRRAFHRETVADTLAAIIEQEPDWERLPPLHPRVRLLLERCLEKKSRDRYHDIADARVDIEVAVADPREPKAEPVIGLVERTGLRMASAAMVIVAALAAGVAGWYLKPPAPPRDVRLSHVLREGQSFARPLYPLVAVSPDGSSIVYVTNDSLFLRRLDALEATSIRGTEGTPTGPFFSPSGRSIGYWDSRDAVLKTIDVSGGTPIELDMATTFRGASWSEDGTILYGKDEGIWAVPASGGEPRLVIAIEEGWANGPQMLPDGHTVLYTLLRGGFVGFGAWESAEIIVQDLENGTPRVITQGEDGRYIPTGHVVYAVGTTLFAVPFDAKRREVIGGPVPVVEGVRRESRVPGATTASANYDFARDGMLAYVDHPGDRPGSVPRDVVVVDFDGVSQPLTDERRNYWRPTIDPHGRRVAVEVFNGETEQVWILDIDTGVATRLTFEGTLNNFPVWTPDGEFVIFKSDRIEGGGIFRKPWDSSGPAELLASPGSGPVPTDVSKDGILVFSLGGQTGERSIWTLPLEGGSAMEFLTTPAMEHHARFSPDGAWLAYASGTDGAAQSVFIRPHPLVEGTERQVSEGYGRGPVWAPDGSELYYVGPESIMVVPILPGFVPGRPRPLFPLEEFRFSGNSSAFDILPDGDGFIMVTVGDLPPQPQGQINFVFNWFEELKERVPTGGSQ